MRKLRLKLDALRIESFTTDANPLRRGTVQGQSGTYTGDDTYCTTLSEDPSYRIDRCGNPTAEATCSVSCGYGVCPQTPNTACEI